MKKVLVIGSSGLLGSHVVKALKGDHEVVEAAHKNAPLEVDITRRESLAFYYRGDRPGAVAVLECQDVDEARRVMAELPLVKHGLIELQFIPLLPFAPFGRLIRNEQDTP